MKWSRPNIRPGCAFSLSLATLFFLSLNGCAIRQAAVRPSIEFNVVPLAQEGGPDKQSTVSGRVVGARPGQRLVLFAKSGIWWVQPTVEEPFTTIKADSTWTTSIHMGTEYAALLVQPSYRPPATLEALPPEGGDVIAVKTVHGRDWEATQKTLLFSGYEWHVRNVGSNRGGRENNYETSNAWTDENGFLHLRIANNGGRWSCAEVKLLRSLGYGSYRFVVRDVSQLEPAAVLSLFTWDDSDAGQNHREMNIEMARWGDAASKNAQYVVQPYYVPANVVRFDVPAGVLTHSFRWEEGRVAFKTVRGSVADAPSMFEHVFTSGVPSPGGETMHLDLFIFGNAKDPLQKDAEVVIEKFEYLP
jgi:hypothetical protein